MRRRQSFLLSLVLGLVLGSLLTGTVALGAVYQGTAGSDVETGTNNIDTFNMRAGDDTIFGRNEGDQVSMDADKDLAYGEGGGDTIDMGGGNDQTRFPQTGVYGGEGQGGQDEIYGGADDDTLRGYEFADQIYGQDNEDVLDGVDGSGNDYLNGGNGNDFCAADPADTKLLC